MAFLTTMFVGALLKGATSIASTIAKTSETRKQLGQKLDDLKTAQNNLNDTYNLNVRNATESNDQANVLINLQADQTTATRDRNVSNSSKTTTANDQIALAQIATLQTDVAKAEGQAVQNAAQSGFRSTGSALNNIYETNRSNQSSLNQAMMQRNLSLFSNYSQARESFISANNQLDVYKRQVENNNADTSRKIESMTLAYQQQSADYATQAERYKADLDYTHSGEYWALNVLNIGTDIFAGASSGASLGYSYDSAKRAAAGAV